MTWDKDIPAPTKQPKWDFESAEIGWSMTFTARKDAVKFANALRQYARDNDKGWGALVNEQIKDQRLIGEWRVWIVEKRKRKAKDNLIEKIEIVMKPENFHVNPTALAALGASFNQIPLSTDTDDDIMLSTD